MVSAKPAAHAVILSRRQRPHIGEHIPDLVISECFSPGSHCCILLAVVHALKQPRIQFPLNGRGCEVGDRRSKLHLPISLPIDSMATDASRRKDDPAAEHITLRLRYV